MHIFLEFYAHSVMRSAKLQGKSTEKQKKIPNLLTDRLIFSSSIDLMFFVSRSQTHKSARDDRSQEKNNRNCDHHTESRCR